MTQAIWPGGPPVIDAQQLFAPERAGAPPPPEVAAAISAACSSWGFFQLTNHGSSAALLERMDAEARAFFALPLDRKLQARALEPAEGVRRSADNAMGFAHDELTKQARDLKEVFDFCRVPHPSLPDDHPANRTIDGHNRWPAALPEFQAAMKAWFAEMERCAFRLLEAFCAGLGLEPTALHHLFEGQHTSFLRLNYYPVVEGGGAAATQAQQQQQQANGGGGGGGRPPLGVNQHTDAGFLTILVQDPQVAGLQALSPQGEWVTVQPIPGALTINVGDQCQVLSNDRFKAPLHRVLASTAGRERFSAPFFFNPRPDADLAPLPRFVDASHPPAFRPINWGAFRSLRFAGDYADTGEEVQIANYRIGQQAQQAEQQAEQAVQQQQQAAAV